MLSLINTIYLHSYFWLRSIVKWFIHRTTKLCEIQRICYGFDKGAARAIAFEYSLRHSKNKVIQSILQQLNIFCSNRRLQGENGHQLVFCSASAVIKAKRIKVNINKTLHPLVTTCLAQVFGYQQLIHEVENIRKIAFQSQNDDHENKLLKLWNNLIPDEPLISRICKQWGTIGFQGDDPKTDFRGMGLLGLENLLYFSTNYTSLARQVLSHSHHPQYGYSFAIVGINITSMTSDLLNKNLLQTHMFNSVEGRPSIKHFHQVYVYLFYEFDKFWMSSKPKDIMEFNRIKDLFLEKIIRILKPTSCILKINVPIETI